MMIGQILIALALVNAVFGVYVFYKNSRSRTNLYFMLTLLALAWWVFSRGLAPLRAFAGPAGAVYFLMMLLLAGRVISDRSRPAGPVLRPQLTLLLLGIGLPAVVALIVNLLLPLLGWPQFKAYGPLASAAVPVLVGYAMIRYHSLGVELVVGRGFFYAAVAAFFAGFYVIISTVWKNWLGLPHPQVVTAVSAGLVTAVTYNRLEDSLRRLTEKFLYGRKYSQEKIMMELSRQMVRSIEAREIAAILLAVIRDNMRVAAAGYFILDPVRQAFVSLGERYDHLVFSLGDPLIEYLEKGPACLMISQMTDQRATGLGSALGLLESAGIELIVPALKQNRLEGFLVLGAKTGGEAFSRYDRRFVASLIKQASFALANAFYYAQAKESEKLASLGEMSASIAHEIKNSLNALSMFADLLKVQSDDPSFISEAAVVIPQETQRLDGLLRSLLNFSSQEVPAVVCFDLNDKIMEVVTLMRKQAAGQKIRIDFIPGPIPPIEADPDQLKQVIINLILNSIQAMAETGGLISLATARYLSRLGPASRQAGRLEQVVITVSDNGPGISEKHLARLFGRFFTTKRGGTGLGLATSYRIIVEKHHGKLQVDSRIKQGTTFKMILPVKQPPETPKAEAA